MTHPTHTSDSSRPGEDFKRGAAFALLTLCVFVLLLGAGRPQWATPWLLASVFTFGVWRMSRAPGR
jgi:hypothetical protein